MPALNDGFGDGLSYCEACRLFFNPDAESPQCPHPEFKVFAQQAGNLLFTLRIKKQIERVLMECGVSKRPGEL